MDQKALVDQFDQGLSELEALLDMCPEEAAGTRGQGDPRTVAAIANHIADWLYFVAGSIPAFVRGSGPRLDMEVMDEIDAGFAKASAGRAWSETRLRLRASAAEVRVALDRLTPEDLSVPLIGPRSVATPLGEQLHEWTCLHVQVHSEAIRLALPSAGRAR